MERRHYTKTRQEWHYITDEERAKLEVLVDELRHERGPLRKWRLPTGRWARILGRDPSTIRRELDRGRMRMGSEDTFVHWCCSARISAEKSAAAANRKGRACDLVRRRDAPFVEGIACLTQLLLRKSTLKAVEGYYSIFAAIEVAKRQVKGFNTSESSVRNWIKRGLMGNLTMAKVAIWMRAPSAKQKRTFPCNAPSKEGHHIADRPKEVDELKVYGHCEGDTIVSCAGDTTAVYSLLERISTFQWSVKMCRNTTRCLHGALRRIVASGAGIKTVTHDNGAESSRVKAIERVLHAGGASGTCAFYADAYNSNQRARNEKNHTFHRRFLGHGKLSRHSQRTIQKVTDFINDYPRRKFYGKSAREVRDVLLAGGTPAIRPRQLRKWERAAKKAAAKKAAAKKAAAKKA